MSSSSKRIRRRPFRSSTEKTVYHEAGHAVVALAQGVEVRRVSISGRCCEYGKEGQPVNEYAAIPSDRRRLLKAVQQSIVLAYAGLAAEAVFTGQDPRKSEGTSFDENLIGVWASSMFDTDDEESTWAFIEKCWRGAKRILRRDWQAMESLAVALLEQQDELDGPAVLNAIGPVLPAPSR